MVSTGLGFTLRPVSCRLRTTRMDVEGAFYVWAYPDVNIEPMRGRIEAARADLTMKRTPPQIGKSGSFLRRINFCLAFWLTELHSQGRCTLYSCWKPRFGKTWGCHKCNRIPRRQHDQILCWSARLDASWQSWVAAKTRAALWLSVTCLGKVWKSRNLMKLAISSGFILTYFDQVPVFGACLEGMG